MSGRIGTATVDQGGLQACLSEAQPVAYLQAKATAIVEEARQLGPRNPRHRTHEIDKLAVGETHDTDHGVVVDIDWPSSVWHLEEFGSVNNPPYAPVRRAAQNNGLHVVDQGPT